MNDAPSGNLGISAIDRKRMMCKIILDVHFMFSDIKNQVTIAWAKWSWAVLNFSFEKKCEFFIKSPGQIFSSVLIELYYAKNNYFLTE